MLEAQSFRMHSSTTERTVCYVQPSRQVHRRVQARDRRLHHLDGQADNGMLRRTGPEFQDREQVGAEPPARACRRARPKAEDRELREAKRRIRELEMENAFLKKAAAFFAKSQA